MSVNKTGIHHLYGSYHIWGTVACELPSEWSTWTLTGRSLHRHSGKRAGVENCQRCFFFSFFFFFFIVGETTFVLTWGMWTGILEPSSKTRSAHGVSSASFRLGHYIMSCQPSDRPPVFWCVMTTTWWCCQKEKKIWMRISLSTEILAAHLLSGPRGMLDSSWLQQAQQMETWRSWDAGTGSTRANSWSAAGEHMTSALGSQPPSGKQQVESFPRKGV